MQTQEFLGYNLRDCLEQVRDTLGGDAIIVETRKVRLTTGDEALCVVAASDEKTRASHATPLSEESSATLAKTLSQYLQRPEEPQTNASAVAVARTTYARAAKPAPESEPARREPQNLFPSRLDTREQSREPTPLVRRAVFPTVQRPSAAPQTEGQNVRSAQKEPLVTETQTPDQDRMERLEAHLRVLQNTIADLRSPQVPAPKPVATPARPRAIEPATLPVQESQYPEMEARLKKQGVSERLIQEVLQQLPNLSAWRKSSQAPLMQSAVRDRIAQHIPCAGAMKLTPGALKTVAFVGTTGVGKTTTLAKLAAHFAQQGQKRVAMLTLDTFRVAAVDQLKTYSQVLKTPLTVVTSLKEAQGAKRQFRNYDLLLVDTAGRNPRNAEHLSELKTLLEALECETHLVLAAPTKEEDARETIKRYTALQIDRLLFTKLDETTTFGSLLNLADSADIPLSYFTTGQQVPGDIERADGRTLAEALLPTTG